MTNYNSACQCNEGFQSRCPLHGSQYVQSQYGDPGTWTSAQPDTAELMIRIDRILNITNENASLRVRSDSPWTSNRIVDPPSRQATLPIYNNNTNNHLLSPPQTANNSSLRTNASRSITTSPDLSSSPGSSPRQLSRTSTSGSDRDLQHRTQPWQQTSASTSPRHNSARGLPTTTEDSLQTPLFIPSRDNIVDRESFAGQYTASSTTRRPELTNGVHHGVAEQFTSTAYDGAQQVHSGSYASSVQPRSQYTNAPPTSNIQSRSNTTPQGASYGIIISRSRDNNDSYVNGSRTQSQSDLDSQQRFYPRTLSDRQLPLYAQQQQMDLGQSPRQDEYETRNGLQTDVYPQDRPRRSNPQQYQQQHQQQQQGDLDRPLQQDDYDVRDGSQPGVYSRGQRRRPHLRRYLSEHPSDGDY